MALLNAQHVELYLNIWVVGSHISLCPVLISEIVHQLFVFSHIIVKYWFPATG